MNLWAKRAGQLLLGAVLFFSLSCDDDSFLLGIKGKTKFQGRYQELVFDGELSSVLLLDSVSTDQYVLSADPVPVPAYRFMIGQYNDPEFGTVRNELYAQFMPNNDPNNPPYFNTANETLELDSVTVQLRFDYYVYGPEQDIDEKVAVHRLGVPPIDAQDSLSSYERYYNFSTTQYDPVPMAEFSFKMSQLVYDLANDAGRDSSFFLKGTLGTKFDENEPVEPPGWTFAKELFLYVNSTGDSALVGANAEQFSKQFLGLAFIPTQSDRVLGFNPLHGSSQLTMHYQSTDPPRDSLTLSFYFTPYPWVGAQAYTNITATRTGDLAGLPEPNVPYYPVSGKRYIQDGTAVITELDLSEYYSFIDTLESIIINSAEISVAVENPPAGMPPPSSLYAMLMKETFDGKIVPLEMAVESDSLKMTQFVSNVFTELISFVVSSELSNQSPLVLTYDNSSRKYKGYATMFFQKLFDNKDEPEYNIEHIGFYPAVSPLIVPGRSNNVPLLKSGVGNEVNRAVLSPNGIKLKLYYTVPNKPNL